MSADVECQSKDCDKNKTNLETKAHDLMVKGRLLNAGEKYSQEAFDLLSKSIKLNPNLIDAWVELTECYQRKSDIEGAIVCLENALKYCKPEEPNKIILRKLSICIRQKNCASQEEKVATLLRSLDLSKQALKIDLGDEENYYNLAKAYMCLFFVTECVDRKLINLSRAAFKQALGLSQRKMIRKVMERGRISSGQSNAATNNQPGDNDKCAPEEKEEKVYIRETDFLFNYATVLVYLQEFTEALEFLRLAVELDHEWEEPKKLEESLVDYLKQISLMSSELRNKRKVVRRHSKVVESLKDVSKIEAIILSDQQRLKRSADISVKSIALEEMKISEESDESGEADELETKISAEPARTDNTVHLLHLKLVSTINYNQAMYVTFMAIDQNYSVVVITIYNLAASRCPIQKDTVTLVNPKMEEVSVRGIFPSGPFKDISLSYKRINVREFKDLYVNGHRISIQQVSKPQCKISVL